MAMIEVKVPDIGDFADVGVIEVLVGVGDRVEVEQSLVTVESDKASMEIPSSAAGVVKELVVGVGDKVSEGSVLLRLEAAQAGAEVSPAPASTAPAAPAAHHSPRRRRAPWRHPPRRQPSQLARLPPKPHRP